MKIILKKTLDARGSEIKHATASMQETRDTHLIPDHCMASKGIQKNGRREKGRTESRATFALHLPSHHKRTGYSRLIRERKGAGRRKESPRPGGCEEGSPRDRSKRSKAIVSCRSIEKNRSELAPEEKGKKNWGETK